MLAARAPVHGVVSAVSHLVTPGGEQCSDDVAALHRRDHNESLAGLDNRCLSGLDTVLRPLVTAGAIQLIDTSRQITGFQGGEQAALQAGVDRAGATPVKAIDQAVATSLFHPRARPPAC